jgi:hypothetical protein
VRENGTEATAPASPPGGTLPPMPCLSPSGVEGMSPPPPGTQELVPPVTPPLLLPAAPPSPPSSGGTWLPPTVGAGAKTFEQGLLLQLVAVVILIPVAVCIAMVCS